MQDFDFTQFKPYAFLIIGLAAVLLSILKKNRAISLKNTGEKVEGIIYELGQTPNYYRSESRSVAPVNDKVTVRFVTKKEEWVTSDLKQPFALFFSGQYKPGDKVDVYYDTENPSNFYIDTKQSESAARILIAVVGLVFCFVGLYLLFAA